MKLFETGFDKSNFYRTIIFLSLLAITMCLSSFCLADKISEEALKNRIKEVDTEIVLKGYV